MAQYIIVRVLSFQESVRQLVTTLFWLSQSQTRIDFAGVGSNFFGIDDMSTSLLESVCEQDLVRSDS